MIKIAGHSDFSLDALILCHTLLFFFFLFLLKYSAEALAISNYCFNSV